MIRRIVIQSLAEGDLTQAASWYESQRINLGDEFLAEVELALQLAAASPRQFPCFRRRPEVRRIIPKRFPYRIFFVVEPERIVVFRVLHGARDDVKWQTNIPKFPA